MALVSLPFQGDDIPGEVVQDRRGLPAALLLAAIISRISIAILLRDGLGPH